MDQSADALQDRCAAQIGDLHRVIEEWLTGRVPRTPESFSAFAAAHVSGFTMITPDGELLGRDELLPGFEGAYASAPGLSIRIADVTVLRADAASVVVTYEEWQDGPAGPSGRRSTALLDRDPTATHGLRSHHLHETWIRRGR